MLAPVPAAGHRTQLPARGWGTQQRVAAPVWENPEWLVAPSFSWAQLLSWLLLPFKEESSGATPLCQICLSSKRISSVMYLTSTILAIPSYNEELETRWDAFSWGHTLRTQRMVLKGGLCPDVSLFLLFFFFPDLLFERQTASLCWFSPPVAQHWPGPDKSHKPGPPSCSPAGVAGALFSGFPSYAGRELDQKWHKRD